MRNSIQNIQAKELEILAYLIAFIKRNHYAPTVRQIADAFHLPSTSTAHGYLQRLEAGGYITHAPGQMRTIVVTEKGLAQ